MSKYLFDFEKNKWGEYRPIAKRKGFDPSPVAGNIPEWADSTFNPKVEGTKAWEDFWFEQFHRCIHGYDTGGIHIPGRYYFYLNFWTLSGLKGTMYPMFVDWDLEYFQAVEFVKERRKPGIIHPKARRKGASEKFAAIARHGLSFTEGYRAAIASGQERWVKGLKAKFDFGSSRLRKELTMNALTDNEDVYRIGYQTHDEIGGYKDDGFGGTMLMETMYDKATKLEGEYFNDVGLEESGQFEKLYATYNSIKPALEFGSEMLGTFYIYGTGANILTTCKDFKDLWDNAETYGLLRLWAPGNRLYFPFFGNSIQEVKIDDDSGKEFDAIPNLRKYKPHERIGMEDIQAAEDYILKKRLEYAKLPDKKKLIEWNQKYPLTIEEAFTSGGSNNFNNEKIYEKLYEIDGYAKSPLNKYVLEFKMENIGGKWMNKYPLEVKAVPFKEGVHREDEAVYILEHPKDTVRNLDVGGIDSYNEDITTNSESLGAMVVMRNGFLLNAELDKDWEKKRAIYPVCLYYDRPRRKEYFFDICLKIAIYYGLLRNTMVSAEHDFVIQHFVNYGCKKYLSPRPKSFDAPGGSMANKYGAKFTGHSKPLALGIAQSYVEDYIGWNEYPKILKDFLAYDEEHFGTDWDSVDAIFYALMRFHDIGALKKIAHINNIPNMGDLVYDENGNLVAKQNEEKIRKEKERGWSSCDIMKPSKEGVSFEDLENMRKNH